MRRLSSPLLALLLALLLLASQQAALAHMLGHAAAGAAAPEAATTIAQGEDAEHGAALVLSHVCTTCIAFAAADLAPPQPSLPAVPAASRSAALPGAVSPAPTVAFRAAFRSRAPPPLQDR